MNKNELKKTAESLVPPKKGIFAADWGISTATKHFEKNSIESTEENRRLYRQMLLTTAGIEEFISGVIFHDETIQQESRGKPFPQLLVEKGIIPGIKVDQGKEFTNEDKNEYIINGLHGLSERLVGYKKLGARFAKWRAAYIVSENTPSDENIEKNSHDLASYALACQENDIVPVIEPEVLMDGDHSLNDCRRVTYRVLKNVFTILTKMNVYLPGMLLKPNMVVSGKNLKKDDPETVSGETFAVLSEVVPEEVPGVVFLSGGQTPEQACANLNELNKRPSKPWELSFSFARGLQYPAITIWAGKEDNVEAAQKAFYKRAKLTSLARQGEYSSEMEDE